MINSQYLELLNMLDLCVVAYVKTIQLKHLSGDSV